MRVLFDGATLCGSDGCPGAGIEHYSISLLSALAQASSEDQFLVSLPFGQRAWSVRTAFSHLKNITWLSGFLPHIPFVSRHILLPARAAAVRADLFFSPIGQLPLGWRGGPSVMTVHDISIFDHPEWFPQESVESFTTRHIVPSSFERASAIICVSEWTQSRLHERFPVTRNKTHVVYEGVELGHHKQVEYTDRFPFDRDYVLCLGTIEPRKNLPSAFAAFDQFLTMHPELAHNVRLIVVGKRGWKTYEVDRTTNDAIHFLGPVTEEEKWYLLSHAACLLFPSFEEGFGLPVLEAMSVGTPVIASNGGALPEVVGDVAILVDPDDVETMALSIAQCLLVPEGVQSLREEGYRRAKQFSWEQTAQQTLEVFRSLITHHMGH
jgi:glycosyltransferase involved in cell wall biosynthesis